MRKKICFFDIDGTLIGFDGRQMIMPESTKIAIRKFRETGNLAVICSGRPMRFIAEQFGEEMFDAYVCGNGTYIVFQNKCIYNRLIEVITIKQLISSFDDLGVSCNFIGPYNSYPHNLDKHRVEKINLWFRGEPYVIENWEISNIKANSLDIFYKDEMQLKKCIDYFKNNLIFNPHGSDMSADVSFKAWNKSDGIKYLVDFIGMSMEDTLAFGDGNNDIDMLKIVKTGIAMGNAVSELKEHADYVTTDIFNNGIYNALDKFGFI